MLRPFTSWIVGARNAQPSVVSRAAADPLSQVLEGESITCVLSSLAISSVDENAAVRRTRYFCKPLRCFSSGFRAGFTLSRTNTGRSRIATCFGSTRALTRPPGTRPAQPGDAATLLYVARQLRRLHCRLDVGAT